MNDPEALDNWCRGRDSNPHGRLHPRDFKRETGYSRKPLILGLVSRKRCESMGFSDSIYSMYSIHYDFFDLF